MRPGGSVPESSNRLRRSGSAGDHQPTQLAAPPSRGGTPGQGQAHPLSGCDVTELGKELLRQGGFRKNSRHPGRTAAEGGGPGSGLHLAGTLKDTPHLSVAWTPPGGLWGQDLFGRTPTGAASPVGLASSRDFGDRLRADIARSSLFRRRRDNRWPDAITAPVARRPSMVPSLKLPLHQVGAYGTSAAVFPARLLGRGWLGIGPSRNGVDAAFVLVILFPNVDGLHACSWSRGSGGHGRGLYQGRDHRGASGRRSGNRCQAARHHGCHHSRLRACYCGYRTATAGSGVGCGAVLVGATLVRSAASVNWRCQEPGRAACTPCALAAERQPRRGLEWSGHPAHG